MGTPPHASLAHIAPQERLVLSQAQTAVDAVSTAMIARESGAE